MVSSHWLGDFPLFVLVESNGATRGRLTEVTIVREPLSAGHLFIKDRNNKCV